MGLGDYFPAGHGHFGVPCSFLRSGTQTWLEAGPFLDDLPIANRASFDLSPAIRRR